MRWIKERTEALLQLQCIEVNGDRESFIAFVHERAETQAEPMHKNLSIKSTETAALPTCGLT